MKLIWSEEAWEDYLYWQDIDKWMVKKTNELIKEARRTPFEGKGKQSHLNITLLVSGRAVSPKNIVWFMPSPMTP
ncbi:hypothetical protein PEC302107_30050 [Pectobacterium araliae]|uniref:Putative mRNA interferase YoeB n=1 Tax=Pectobacterium araliae TaxID=3073862 RepID=A0AAN0MN57_9GAMM|nr:hypothetical protein PEC302110_35120 [Pectobacterium sp. MAFF 302110]GKW21276.1 hypothetical protein PEC302107_30050 [Pectobacterium carotovorum subsp. carotovorum]